MRRTTLGVLLAGAFAAIGLNVYNVSYIDNGKYWGIPYYASQDDSGVVTIAETTDVDQLHKSIAQHYREILALQEQQKYLYNKLYNATVDLEKNSNLDLNLIARIGPNANLYLPDLTKTGEAIESVGMYEVNLPQDSQVRTVMSDVRLALGQENKSKNEYVEKLGKWRLEETEKQALWYEQKWKEAQAKQELEFQRLMNPEPATSSVQEERNVVIPAYDPDYEEYERYQEPNVIEPDPILEDVRTSTDISGKDGEMLGLAHSIMADISITQAKMATTVKKLVQEYQQLDAMLSPSQHLPISYMFVRDRVSDILEEGQPLYRCKIGLFLCRQVGTIKGVTGQKTQAPSPTSGKLQPGFFIPIELTDPNAVSAKILHIYDPPTR